MKLKSIKCPECNASLNIKEDREFCICGFCGCQIHIDIEKPEFTYNQNVNVTHIHRTIDDAEVIRAQSEIDTAAKNSKSGTIVLIVLCLFVLMIPLGFHLNAVISQNNGKVCAGNYSDLIGENYKSVKAHFEAAGFTNIKLVDLKDSGIAFWTDGEVSTISIGGKTDFESIHWFDPDILVVISYH